MFGELHMSRESRKVIDCLAENAKIRGVAECMIVPSHILMCDILCMKYYTAPIINVIKSHIRATKSIKSRMFSMEYMYGIVSSRLSNQGNAMRSIRVDDTIDDDVLKRFSTIIRFLDTDYSIEAAAAINSIIHIDQLSSIEETVRACRDMGVYNIQYFTAVLDGVRAKNARTAADIHRLNEKIKQSDTITEVPIHTHSPFDIQMARYNWDKCVEDNELEKKFIEMFGGFDK